MKKVFLLTVLSIFAFSGFTQTKKSKSQSKPELEQVIYDQAIKYGDVGVVINNLYILIAKHPETNSYKDSLARIYFQVGSYNQCLRVCDELIKINPSDTTVLRMMAMSHQNIGRFVEAIADYEKVIQLTGNVYDTYQKAALEFRIKRLQESKLSTEAVIKGATDKDRIVLYIDQENKQEVPLKAAAFNLYGMIAKEFNDTASARFLFNEAIKMEPEFYFANANLKALDEMGKKKEEEPIPSKPNSAESGDKKK